MAVRKMSTTQTFIGPMERVEVHKMTKADVYATMAFPQKVDKLFQRGVSFYCYQADASSRPITSVVRITDPLNKRLSLKLNSRDLNEADRIIFIIACMKLRKWENHEQSIV